MKVRANIYRVPNRCKNYFANRVLKAQVTLHGLKFVGPLQSLASSRPENAKFYEEPFEIGVRAQEVRALLFLPEKEALHLLQLEKLQPNLKLVNDF